MVPEYVVISNFAHQECFHEDCLALMHDGYLRSGYSVGDVTIDNIQLHLQLVFPLAQAAQRTVTLLFARLGHRKKGNLIPDICLQPMAGSAEHHIGALGWHAAFFGPVSKLIDIYGEARSGLQVYEYDKTVKICYSSMAALLHAFCGGGLVDWASYLGGFHSTCLPRVMVSETAVDELSGSTHTASHMGVPFCQDDVSGNQLVFVSSFMGDKSCRLVSCVPDSSLDDVCQDDKPPRFTCGKISPVMLSFNKVNETVKVVSPLSEVLHGANPNVARKFSQAVSWTVAKLRTVPPMHMYVHNQCHCDYEPL